MRTFAKLTCSYLVLVGALTQNVASTPVNQPVPFSQRIQNEASCTAVTKAISGLDKSKVIGFVDQLCKQEDSAPCVLLLDSARKVCSSQGAIGNDVDVTSQSSSIDCSKLETKFNENMNLSPGAKPPSKFFMNGNGVSDNQSCYTLCLRDHHPICPLIQGFLNAIPAKNAPPPTRKSVFGVVGSIARIASGSGMPTAPGAKRVEAEPSPDTAHATGAPEDTAPKRLPGIGKSLGGSASGSPAKDVENTGSASKISTDQKSETKSDDSTQNLKPSELVDTKKAVPEKTNAKTAASVPAMPETKPEPNAEVVPSGNAAIPETKVDIISTTKPKQSTQDIKEEAIAKPSSLDAFDGDGNQDPLDDSAEDFELSNAKTPSEVDSTANKRTESKQSKKEDTYSKVPQLQYNDPLAGPDTGYFGHFIMFLAVCAIIFLLLQNKKRIIAMVIEGPKSTGGRRRTPSTSGSYRKLENNFD